MHETPFEFTVQDYEDYRLIRTVFPQTISMQLLSVVVDRYLALWETDLPIYLIHDLTQLQALSDEVSAVILAILTRRKLDPNFRGSAIFVGASSTLTPHLRDLHVQAGRDPDSVVLTEADALAYIDRCLHRRDASL